MKKYFSFSGTISGTTLLLRTLFTAVLSIPIIIALISKWTSYFVSLGNFDLSDPALENQMAIQAFGDELAQKIADNPEFYLNDFLNSFTFGWVLIFVLSVIPAIWFGLATYYKRVSALFFDQRKQVFLALVLFDIVSDYIVLSSSGVITTIVSSIGILIFIFLVFYNSKFENHEG
jgi:hypothetical protein|tara:strand:+ start:727 stop:1251 length:525 start_codon:yes stop_codon:yes gene_type:complete